MAGKGKEVPVKGGGKGGKAPAGGKGGGKIPAGGKGGKGK